VKIQLQNIEWRNFLSYGNVPQRIDFNEGLSLIMGNDTGSGRSNGAGKSSALLTVPFALFGKTDKDIKKDQIINWKNKKKCEVVLSFKKGNDNYTILRAIKPDKLEIYKEGNLIDIPSDIRVYQKMFERDILQTQMDFNMFMYLIYTNLNSSIPLLKMSSLQKRSFLEHIFGLELYAKINDLSNKKLSLLDEKVFKLQVNIDQNTSTINDLTIQNKSLRSQIVDTSSFEEQLKKVESELSSIETIKNPESIIISIEENINNSVIKYDSICNNIRDIDGEINNLQYNNKLNNDQIKKINEQKEKRNIDIIKTKKDIDDISTQIFDVIQYNPNEDNNRLIELKNKKIQLDNDISILSHDKKYKEDIFNSIKSGVCPTCNREVSPDILKKDYIDYISELQSQIHNKKMELESLQVEIDNLNKSISSNLLILKKHDELEKKRMIESTKLSMLQKDDLPNINDYEKNIVNNTEKISSLIEQKKKLEDEKSNIQLYMNTEKISLKDIKDSISKSNDCKNRILTLKNEIKSKKELTTSIEKIINDNENKIKSISNMSITSNKSIVKLRNLLDYLNHLKVLCKDDNVKQFAISSTIPYLEQQVNDYLSESGSNHYLRFDKWLNATIYGSGITSASYESLSSGESRSIDLSIQFSFIDIAKIRADMFPDVLLLDEILDSSIDSFGINNILRIIKTKQVEDKSKVFIITHRTELSEIEVDHVYQVFKEDGFSRICKVS